MKTLDKFFNEYHYRKQLLCRLPRRTAKARKADGKDLCRQPRTAKGIKMEENSSTSEHVLRMSEYYNRLNQVGVNLPDKIVIDRIL